MLLYRLSYENGLKFEQWANENNMDFEELDDDNYLESCPDCGDSEFMSRGSCGHCGYSW